MIHRRIVRSRARSWFIAITVAVTMTVTACTGSEPDRSEPTADRSAYQEALRDTVNRVEHQYLTSELTPEEFLARVHDDDVDEVRVLLYPDDHPQAGAFIPFEEWEEAQRRAWSTYVVSPGNGRAMVLVDRLMELFTQYCWAGSESVDDLSYEEAVEREVTTVEYAFLTGDLTPEELLDRVPGGEEQARALIYPDDHPQAGEFVPVEEWGDEQRRAWEVYVTTAGNGRAAALEGEVLALYRQHC